MMHGVVILSVTALNLVLRLVWREAVGVVSIRSFRVSDACVWFYCVASSIFSVHLSESTECPATGWIWPSVWMLALASCDAGVPRALPAN